MINNSRVLKYLRKRLLGEHLFWKSCLYSMIFLLCSQWIYCVRRRRAGIWEIWSVLEVPMIWVLHWFRERERAWQDLRFHSVSFVSIIINEISPFELVGKMRSGYLIFCWNITYYIYFFIFLAITEWLLIHFYFTLYKVSRCLYEHMDI